MEQPLTVQQELTYKEYLSAMLYVFASSRRAKWYLIGIFGLIMVSNLLGPGSITAIDLITMLAPLVMMILLFVTFITIACYYIYKSRPYLFHHVSYVFTDWGCGQARRKNPILKALERDHKIQRVEGFLLFICR